MWVRARVQWDTISSHQTKTHYKYTNNNNNKYMDTVHQPNWTNFNYSIYNLRDIDCFGVYEWVCLFMSVYFEELFFERERYTWMLPSAYYDEIIDHFNDCAKCSIDAIFLNSILYVFFYSFPKYTHSYLIVCNLHRLHQNQIKTICMCVCRL